MPYVHFYLSADTAPQDPDERQTAWNGLVAIYRELGQIAADAGVQISTYTFLEFIKLSSESIPGGAAARRAQECGPGRHGRVEPAAIANYAAGRGILAAEKGGAAGHADGGGDAAVFEDHALLGQAV